MQIVLNEYDWAEKAIASRELGNKPSETFKRVAKYYIANKYSKKETRQMLDTFLLQCDPNASLVGWSDTLDRASKAAIKYPLIQVEGVYITKGELEKIDALNGTQLKRLAFTLLCISRYWDLVSASNNHWVNCNDKDIMRMADVNTSLKRQSALYAELRNLGYIKFSKKIDNLNVQVLFGEDIGEAELFVQDFRSLGFQYLKYCGGPYYECENCGLVCKTNGSERGRKQKYCPGCAVELHTKQKVESVMRNRNENKTLTC